VILVHILCLAGVMDGIRPDLVAVRKRQPRVCASHWSIDVIAHGLPHLSHLTVPSTWRYAPKKSVAFEQCVFNERNLLGLVLVMGVE
jgi:hypothetical protein